MAKWFSKKVQKYRYIGFVYVIAVFFLLPFSLIYFDKKEIIKTNFDKKIEIKHKKNVTATLSG